MKKMIFSSVMSMLSLMTFAQTYEVEFDEYIGFNAGNLRKYEEVTDTSNYNFSENHFGGTNRYVINLTEKKMDRYFDGFFEQSKPILTYEKAGDLIYITIEDSESVSGNNVISNVVINTNKNNKRYPKFVLYFVSTKTNTTNGFVAPNYSLLN